MHESKAAREFGCRRCLSPPPLEKGDRAKRGGGGRRRTAPMRSPRSFEVQYPDPRRPGSPKRATSEHLATPARRRALRRAPEHPRSNASGHQPRRRVWRRRSRNPARRDRRDVGVGAAVLGFCDAARPRDALPAASSGGEATARGGLSSSGRKWSQNVKSPGRGKPPSTRLCQVPFPRRVRRTAAAPDNPRVTPARCSYRRSRACARGR